MITCHERPGRQKMQYRAEDTAARSVSVDDVITTVDIERLAGDQTRRIMRQKRRRRSDIVYAHKTAYRRFDSGCLKQVVKFGDAGCGAGCERAGRYRMDTDAF